MPTPTAAKDPKDPLTVFKRFDPALLRAHPKSAAIYQDQPSQELLESVRERGVIEPLVLAADEKTVVSGRRRRQAAITAKKKSVPCVVRTDLKDPLDIREAILDANIHNDRTNEQKAREFQERRDIEAARAAARQKATQFGTQSASKTAAAPPTLTSTSATTAASDDESAGRAEELAAQTVGWSAPTAKAATEVLVAADEAKRAGKEEEAEKLLDTLNETSVAAAHRLVKKKRKKPAKRVYTAERLSKAKTALATLIRNMPQAVYRDTKKHLEVIKTKLQEFSITDK